MPYKLTNLDLDVVIFGSGCVGLWTLARLRQAGYAAMLLERQRLGGVQTLASQGIIHGGIKYALTGTLTNAAQAIGAMPAIWRACLQGTGELDLSKVTVLAEHQCLWSTGKLGSTLAGLFASRAMRSRVTYLEGTTRPEVLQHPQFHGHVYRLDEPVLDVASLMQELVHKAGDTCLHLDPEWGLAMHKGTPHILELKDENAGILRLRAPRILLAAGAGNEQLLASLGQAKPTMQRRPLHMLMLSGNLPPLYAHCLGVSANPRLTITSHPITAGKTVWYIGGQLAESGVNRSSSEQIAAGRRELAEILPWLDISTARWASFTVNRAEPRQPGGMRPEQPFLQTKEGISVAWPTKLAFAPAVSNAFLDSLAKDGIKPSGLVAPLDWPRPQLPQLPWEQVPVWS